VTLFAKERRPRSTGSVELMPTLTLVEPESERASLSGTTRYNQERGLTAAAEIFKPAANLDSRVDKRPTTAWQTAAWRAFEDIGEVHYGISLIGQLVSRVRIYAGVVTNPDDVPINVETFLKQFEEKALPVELTKEICDAADDMIHDLTSNVLGGEAGMLREMAICLSVAGECYLAQNKDQWLIASNDELIQSASGTGAYKVKLDRSNKKEIELDKDAFVGRVWQPHPRYSNEPDSSMHGVLDSCENLQVLSQQMRSMMRSRMNAGVVFIPDGLVGTGGEPGTSVAEQIAKMATTAIEDETATSTVVPLVLRGAPDLGDKIKHIQIGRAIDDPMIRLADRVLERILVGLDLPKEVIAGLESVKFANAIVIDDALFKAHIEPLVLLIVDALTQVYLRPHLEKWLANRAAKSGLGAYLANGNGDGKQRVCDRIVVWFDSSDVVTRPDKSTAADAGYDRHELSGKAWREARGFAETDKPDEDELVRRLALEKAPVGPDMADTLIESIDPKFFAAERQSAQQEGGFPPGLSDLLDGGQGGGPAAPVPANGEPPAPPDAPESGTPAADLAMSGGRMQPGGVRPAPPEGSRIPRQPNYPK